MIYSWNQRQWQQLTKQREQNMLPHALLLYGDAGCGKTAFAHALAASLFCQSPGKDAIACGACAACYLLAAGTHPDFRVLRPEPPKNSTSKQPVLLIRIDAIRALCHGMLMTSQFVNGYRIAILENADRMNLEAANALLKTLEEPGKNTLLMLTCSHPNRLPVTIRSRCQALRFPRPDRELATHWLQDQGVKQAAQKLALAHGAPLAVVQQGTDTSAARDQFTAALLAGINQDALAHASMLAGMDNHQCLSWMLDWIGDLVRLKLVHADNEVHLVNEGQRVALQGYAGRVDVKRLYALYDQICGYIRAESIALNAELLWENLLLSWQALKQ